LGGGGGVINALLAQEMAKQHDITVLTSQGLGLPRQRIEEGVKVVRVPVFFREQEAVANLCSMGAFVGMGIKEGRKLITSQRFDIINTHFVLPTGPVGDILSRLSGIPNVLSLHGGDLYDPSKTLSPHRYAVLRSCIRRLLRRADVVVGQSQNTLANMRRFYTPEIEGTRIPLAIRRPNFEPASRASYGFTDDDILLVTVGRLVARKGLAQLVAMMDTFKGRPVHLLVIGSGPEEQALKEEVAQRHLAPQVHFMGFVAETEKFRLLQISDLYVSTSQHEGFGLVFLEAMACGLPIICYDHGGQTDFLQNEKTGYLIPLNHLEFFRQRCQLLVHNRELRQTMGQDNACRAEGFFIHNCAARYEDVFKQALELRMHAKQRPFYQQHPA
jgi:glycosyltransferase involved in cell wall biosynthesis